MAQKEKFAWTKTDTAAVMFTAINKNNFARIIRASAVLNDEVNPEILKKAVENVIPLFPVFAYRIRKGAFWGYLEHTSMMPEICQESQIPGVGQWLGANGGPDYRVLYFKKRISLEINHVLCDGSGMFSFLKSIVAEYLTLTGVDTSDCEGILLPGKKIPDGQGEFPYPRYYTGEKMDAIPKADAHFIPFKCEGDYLKNLNGFFRVDQIKKPAHELSLTITEYLVSVMILAIIKTTPEPINKDISVAVPSNMRNILPSDTLRNFSKDVPVNFNPHGKKDCTIEEIAKAVKGQIVALVNEYYVRSFINSSYALTANKAIGIIPGFVKWIGFSKIQKNIHQKSNTIMISNMGNMKLPESMEKNITRLDFFGGNPKCYGINTFCTGIGYKGYMSFGFSTCNRDTTLAREFFKLLVDTGVDVRIESTDENGVNNYEM